MRVGWLVDEPTHPGGAELTQAEFRAAAPDDVEIVRIWPGKPVDDCGAYVIHNCMQYTLEDLDAIPKGIRVTKFWHDVGPWLPQPMRDKLSTVSHICCSPLQATYMGLDAVCIPPAVNLDRFAQAAAESNGSRSGAVCIGSWRNYGKAPHKAAEWAARNGGVDFYGDGPLAPPDSRPVSYDAMPALLAQYETLVFLPTVLEPFGRVVAEAWAAGCEVVTNGLVGAGWWIREAPDKLETAGEDFWRTVLA